MVTYQTVEMMMMIFEWCRWLVQSNNWYIRYIRSDVMLMIDKSDVDDDNEFDNEDGINDDDDKNNIILFNRIES